MHVVTHVIPGASTRINDIYNYNLHWFCFISFKIVPVVCPPFSQRAPVYTTRAYRL